MNILWKFDGRWRWATRAPAIVSLLGGLVAAHCWPNWFAVGTLQGQRQAIYGVLVTTLGTLLAISFTVTAMLVSFADRKSLSVYARTKDYTDISVMMRDANRSLAVSSVLAFVLLIVENTNGEQWVLAVFLGACMWAVLTLAMAVNRFTTMLQQVTDAHHKAAKARHQKDTDAFNAGATPAPIPTSDAEQ